jgi:hypothetical protein
MRYSAKFTAVVAQWRQSALGSDASTRVVVCVRGANMLYRFVSVGKKKGE